MKKICIFIPILLFGTFSCKEKITLKNEDKGLVISDADLNVGKVDLFDTLSVDFEIKNTSNEVIFIKNIQSDCGCIIETNYQDTLAKDSYTKLTVKFVPDQSGVFKKNIIVRSSGNPEFHSLFFRGEVINIVEKLP